MRAVTGITYFLLGVCLVARLVSRGNDARGQRAVDGMPYLTLLFLGTGWAAYRGDPLRVLGLSPAVVTTCPWRYMAAVWLVGFASSRIMNAYVLHSDIRRLVADGTMNPGGTYLALAGKGFSKAAILGVAMTCSQTFLEEFFFRGLLMSGGIRIAQVLGARRDLAFVCAVTVSSILFGLAHFIPAKRMAGLSSVLLLYYAFAMPTVLGVIFCVLDASARSLWPGWLVHWGLNYSGFVWDRAFGQWDRASPASAGAPQIRTS